METGRLGVDVVEEAAAPLVEGQLQALEQGHAAHDRGDRGAQLVRQDPQERVAL